MGAGASATGLLRVGDVEQEVKHEFGAADDDAIDADAVLRSTKDFARAKRGFAKLLSDFEGDVDGNQLLAWAAQEPADVARAFENAGVRPSDRAILVKLLKARVRLAEPHGGAAASTPREPGGGGDPSSPKAARVGRAVVSPGGLSKLVLAEQKASNAAAKNEQRIVALEGQIKRLSPARGGGGGGGGGDGDDGASLEKQLARLHAKLGWLLHRARNDHVGAAENYAQAIRYDESLAGARARPLRRLNARRLLLVAPGRQPPPPPNTHPDRDDARPQARTRTLARCGSRRRLRSRARRSRRRSWSPLRPTARRCARTRRWSPPRGRRPPGARTRKSASATARPRARPRTRALAQSSRAAASATRSVPRRLSRLPLARASESLGGCSARGGSAVLRRSTRRSWADARARAASRHVCEKRLRGEN